MKCCDLLENSYLCGISNNISVIFLMEIWVVICLKIRTFVVSATTMPAPCIADLLVVICLKIRTFVVSATTIDALGYELTPLWFAWKFVPLWYQQQLLGVRHWITTCCDLLENSYLCGISNNLRFVVLSLWGVVICLKIRTFVVSATTSYWYSCLRLGCDLLENSYLCGISNNYYFFLYHLKSVVICLKIRTFVVSATTTHCWNNTFIELWFAWKFVPLWYQQQRTIKFFFLTHVVICLKIRTFVVSATTSRGGHHGRLVLWFAWKFVPLWYQQQLKLDNFLVSR